MSSGANFAFFLFCFVFGARDRLCQGLWRSWCREKLDRADRAWVAAFQTEANKIGVVTQIQNPKIPSSTADTVSQFVMARDARQMDTLPLVCCSLPLVGATGLCSIEKARLAARSMLVLVLVQGEQVVRWSQ